MLNIPNHILRDLDNKHIISFDIFDTAIVRPFTCPSHLFLMMQNDVRKILKSRYLDFKALHSIAESEANKIDGSAVSRTLDSVYKAFADINVISNTESNKIKQLELDYELKLCYRREFVYDLYKKAIEDGKEVIFITDTSLPQFFIEKLLEKNGYNLKKHDIYVSCHLKKAKFQGTLFEHVLNEKNLKSSQIVHIGDNKVSDIQKAKELGIKTIFLEKPIDKFFQNLPNQSIWLGGKNNIKKIKSLPQSIYLGIVANKMCDNPLTPYNQNNLFNNSFYNLGFYGLGALLFSFAKWICEQTIKNNITNIYFFSREGEIFKKVYDIVSIYYNNPPKSHYLLTSRRATCVANLKTKQDIFNLSAMRYTDCSLEDLLRKRFGILSNQVDDISLKKAGFSSVKDVINHTKDYRRVIDILNLLSKKILNNAKIERDNYLEYLNHEGLNSNELRQGVAIVDIGYNGSPQFNISQLIKNKEINGFYLLTFPDAIYNRSNGLKMEGFMCNYECFDSTVRAKMASLVIFIESSLCCSEGSLVKFSKNNNKLSPEYWYSNNEGERKDMVTKVHEGITEFNTIICKLFSSEIKNISFNHQMIDEAFYKALMKFEDKCLFKNIDLEDNFKVYKTRSLVSKNKNIKTNSVSKNENIKTNSVSKNKNIKTNSCVRKFIRHPRKFII